MSRQTFRLFAGALALASIGPANAARAADIAAPVAAESVTAGFGVVCTLNDSFSLRATAAALPWPSVWFGHFSGGRPYTDGTGRTLVDWLDEKVCFATRGQCEAWVGYLRQNYSALEGNWTCLFLR
jgi:hypothetical protein